MREFSVRLQEVTRGLYNTDSPAPFSLCDCLGLRPSNVGALISTKPIVFPPFNMFYDQEVEKVPLFWYGRNCFLLLRDAVYTFNKDYTVRDFLNVSSGSSWHVADFGEYAVFSNGVSVVSYQEGILMQNPSNLPRFVTCCNFRGQLFVGGFSVPWESASMDFVGWSKPGSADFTLDKSNTSGYDFAGVGEVLCVKNRAAGVFVGGTTGVCVYHPVASPVPGFGKVVYDSIPGIASRSAVAGSLNDLFLIDSTGYLWVLQYEQAPKRLGYRKFFEPMLGTDIVGTYNPQEQAVYFSNEDVCYRFSEEGLSRHWQGFSSLWNDAGTILGLSKQLEQPGFYLETSSFDFGFGGLKTITSIEIEGSFDEPVYAALDWRTNISHSYRRTAWRRVNSVGVVRFPVTAYDFKLILGSQSQRARIDSIIVKYQISDKRNFRGQVDVDSTNTRTSEQ